MTETQSKVDRDSPVTPISGTIGRRTFVAIGASVGTTLLAGCTTADPATDEQDDDATGGEDSADPTENAAATETTFRLLISDKPADIDDFDRLDVSFDQARVFEVENGADEDDDGQTAPTETQTPAEDAETDDPESEEPSAGETEGDEEVEQRRGFSVLDLDDVTVDLTHVVGDSAMPVFEGDLSEGTYEKIELHVSAVEGIVDGDHAEVKVPSGKLQITHPFEITAGDSVDFVFDINVVQRGQGNRYNLTPVISESGIAGEGVEVNEVDAATEAGGESDTGDDNEGDASE